LTQDLAFATVYCDAHINDVFVVVFPKLGAHGSRKPTPGGKRTGTPYASIQLVSIAALAQALIALCLTLPQLASLGYNMPTVPNCFSLSDFLSICGNDCTVFKVTMSFGFSIGDLITVIGLANKIRKEFVDAPSQFKDVSDE